MNTFIPLATDIMGTKIKTADGEDLGVVQNIMIDPQNGTIIYVVLCYANFMGKTNRYFAIPREMLTLQYGQDASIYLEVDKGDLMDAQPVVPDRHTINHIGSDNLCIYELMSDRSKIAKSYA